MSSPGRPLLLLQPTRNDQNRVYSQIARRYGYLSEGQLQDCRQELEELERQGAQPKFGEVCMMRGHLTEEERKRLAIASSYYFARQEDRLIARIGLRYEFLAEATLQSVFQEQEHLYYKGTESVPRLLGLLVSRGVLDSDKFLDFLKTLQRFSLRHSDIEALALDPSRENGHQSDPNGNGSRRAFERFAVADSLVRVHPKSSWWSGASRFARLRPPADPPAPLTGPLINLSVSGLQTTASQKFTIDQTVRLAIQIPIFETPLETRGRVRWTAPTNGHYRLGVMFTDLDARSESCLQELATNPFLCSVGRSAFELVSV